jgi:hypothetical protein
MVILEPAVRRTTRERRKSGEDSRMPRSRSLLVVALLLMAGCGPTASDHSRADGSSRAPSVAAEPSRQIQFMVGDEGIPELWELDTARPGSQHRIATWPGGTNGFARSPDGTLLATVTLTGVDVLRSDGSHRREAFALPAGTSPAGPAVWSPDSQRIAVPVEPAGIVVARVDGSQQRSVAAGGTVPVWAPDSEHLGYTALDRSLMLLDVDETATAERLAAAGSYPVWSPDGTRVAFVNGQSLVLAGGDGSSPVQAGTADLAFGASWSPDGRQLAFTSNGALNVVNADGSDRHTLLTPTQTDERGLCPGPAGVHCSLPLSCPAWLSPMRLVFRAVELVEISSDGSELVKLTTPTRADLGVSCPFLVPTIASHQ